MAEQAPAVQNKKLLLVAMILAAVVVVIFNVYIRQMRKEGEYVTEKIAAFDKAMNAGDRLRDGDLVAVDFPKKFLEIGLPGVVPWEKRSVAKERTLVQNVRMGEFLRFAQIATDDSPPPGYRIDRLATTFTFPVDSDQVPGDILLPNARINIVGMFSIRGKIEAIPVLEKVRVLSVGGRGASEASPFAAGKGAGSGMRSYRSITVEVPPKVALQLANIQTHATRDFWVQLLNPENITAVEKLAIDPRLEEMAAGAKAPPAPSGPPSGSPGAGGE